MSPPDRYCGAVQGADPPPGGAGLSRAGRAPHVPCDVQTCPRGGQGGGKHLKGWQPRLNAPGRIGTLVADSVGPTQGTFGVPVGHVRVAVIPRKLVAYLLGGLSI